MAGALLTRTLLLLGLALYHFRLAAVIRWIGRHHPKVLLYHDCADAESSYTAGLNSTTSPTGFGRHLDYLAAHYRVVELSQIVQGRAPARSVAITFDDGYRSVYTGAFPHLRRRGMPAVVYLVSDVIDNRALVWVNELNHLLRTGGDRAPRIACEMLGLASDTPVGSIVDHCRIRYDRDLIAALIGRLREGDDGVAVHELYLSTEQISDMAAGGICFGNHTRTHPNLERLSDAAQEEEIDTAQQALRDVPATEPSLAYPFGHHGEATARIAARLGLTSVAEVGGYNPRGPLARIGRVHLSGEKEAALFARMEVVEPIKGLLRELSRRRHTASGY